MSMYVCLHTCVPVMHGCVQRPEEDVVPPRTGVPWVESHKMWMLLIKWRSSGGVLKAEPSP